MAAYYWWGYGGLIALYIASFVLTRDRNPFSLAKGNNQSISLSLLQNLLFTALTVFAYVTVFAARVAALGRDQALQALPDVPANLLIMMGLSFVTSTASKGITISYLKDGELATRDTSGVTAGRDGRTDLTKVQMLAWTLISIGVYIVALVHHLAAGCYIPGTEHCPAGAIPDIDSALLVLMGVSQGGYVAGKLVGRTTDLPTVEHRLPPSAKAGDPVTLYGQSFGESTASHGLILRDPATMAEQAIAGTDLASWSDTEIRFKVPAGTAAKAYHLLVRGDGKTGAPVELEVTP